MKKLILISSLLLSTNCFGLPLTGNTNQFLMIPNSPLSIKSGVVVSNMTVGGDDGIIVENRIKGDYLYVESVDNPSIFVGDVNVSNILTAGVFSGNGGSISNVLHTRDVVTDYNADPLGILDSTLKIQAALNAGGNVYLPFGDYRLTNTLQLTVNNTRFSGLGRLLQYTTNKNVIEITNAAHVRLEGFTIDSSNGGANSVKICNNANDVVIDGLRIISPGISNNFAGRPTGYGIYAFRDDTVGAVGNAPRGISIINTTITNITDTGIEFSGGINSSINNCFAYIGTNTGANLGAAFYAWNGSSNVIFSGCHAYGIGTNGVGFQVNGSNADALQQVQTSDIEFNNCSAINLLKGSAVIGLSTTQNVMNVTIQGCIIRARQYGVTFAQATNVNFINNNVIAWTNAIYMPVNSAISGIRIDDNTLHCTNAAELYGNVNGSFSRNKVSGSGTTKMFGANGWTNCIVHENRATDLGAAGTCLLFAVGNGGTGSESVSNSFCNNFAFETRGGGTNFTRLIQLSDASDYNVCNNNVMTGSNVLPVRKSTTGTHNTILNNVGPLGWQLNELPAPISIFGGTYYPTNDYTAVLITSTITNGGHWIGTLSNSVQAAYMSNNVVTWTTIWGH